MKSLIKFLLVFATTVGLLYLALKDIDAKSIVDTWREVSPGYLLVSIFFLTLAYLARAYRWRQLFPVTVDGSRFKNVFWIMIAGYFFNNILPARAGEVVRAFLMGRENKVSRLGTLSTILWERICDATLLTLFLAIGISAIEGQSDWLTGLFYACLIFPVMMIVLLFVAAKQEHLLSRLHRWSEVVPGHFTEKVIWRLETMIDYLRPMLSLGVAIRQVIWVLIVWGLEVVSYLWIAKAFSVELPWSTILLFVAAVNFASLVPAAPGGLGAIEFVASKALIAVGVEEHLALSLVLCQHAVQYLFCAILGLYAVLKLHVRLAEVESDSHLPLEVQELASKLQTFHQREEKSRTFIEELKKQDQIIVSVIIPAYNEERRIGPTLSSCVEYFERARIPYEIVVVDDGSIDQTAYLVEEVAKTQPTVRLLKLEHNQGKGAAVRRGMLEAKGALLLLNDADGATPITEFSRLLAEAAVSGAEIVVGSRALQSAETSIERKFTRFISGRVFAFLVNIFAVPQISDTQCGFKLFRRRPGQEIFKQQKMNGFAFDVEVLFLARKRGFSIREVAINWHDVDGSKVNVLTDSLRMFRDIFKVRVAHLGSDYQAQTKQVENSVINER